MYNKTIWNSGDIITTEKWNNINNNLSLIEAYQLPASIDTENSKIIINKSYSEIKKMLMEGIICYYYLFDNNNYCEIQYINFYNDSYKTLNDFHEENGQMISYYQKESF